LLPYCVARRSHSTRYAPSLLLVWQQNPSPIFVQYLIGEAINTEKMKEPSFLMVLTGTELAYRRDDGVYIVPIGCLKY
jgi:hypothetical protein